MRMGMGMGMRMLHHNNRKVNDMKDVYRGTIVPGPRGSTTYWTLPGIEYIFVCGDCEYRTSTPDRDAIEAGRNAHNVVAHPEKIVDVLWDDSPLSTPTSVYHG